jgi:hypothetical protein
MSILDSLSLSLSASKDLLSIFTDEKLTGACLDYLEKTLQPPVAAMTPTPTVPAPRIGQSGGVMMCLASVLEALAEYDEKTVFSVRKINKLGFKSHGVLKRYFSSFGEVEAIYFLPYRYKPDTASIRPSSMAFIRMSTREAVEAVFAVGEIHMVRDVPVSVQPFTIQDTHLHTYSSSSQPV